LDKFKKWVSEHPYLYAGIVCVIATVCIVVACLIGQFGVDRSNKFAGIFTPLVVAGVTAYFAWNQLNLGREQKALTERQAEIARQQAITAKENKEIAANKLRLDLFDKRYEVFSKILKHFSFAFDLSLDINDYLCLTPSEKNEYSICHERNFLSGEIYDRAKNKLEIILKYNQESKTDREVDLTKIKLLFDDRIHRILFSFSKESHKLLKEEHDFLSEILDECHHTDVIPNYSIETIDSEKKRLARILNDEIIIAVRPFLKFPE
ncbi:hypothetical protein NKW44_14565, partial [Acetobacter lovaniensis]|uniref:hypothetical protein n=1 Tax=Acetobacter lovaniensis TaxID=104100 RepID=UPI0020A16444